MSKLFLAFSALFSSIAFGHTGNVEFNSLQHILFSPHHGGIGYFIGIGLVYWGVNRVVKRPELSSKVEESSNPTQR